MSDEYDDGAGPADELDELDERVSVAGVPVPGDEDADEVAEAAPEDDVESILAGMSWRKNKPSTPAPAMPDGAEVEPAAASVDDSEQDAAVVAGAALPVDEDEEGSEDEAPVVAGAPIALRESEPPRDSAERLSLSELEEARLSLSELEEMAPPPLPPVTIEGSAVETSEEPDDEEPLALRPLTLPPGMKAESEPEGRVSLVDFGSALSHATESRPTAGPLGPSSLSPPTPFIDPTAPLPQAAKDESSGGGGKYAIIGMVIAAALGLGWYMGQRPQPVAVTMDSAPRVESEGSALTAESTPADPEAEATEPGTVEPGTVEPEATEPEVTEPEAPEPEVTEPEVPEVVAEPRILTEEELALQEARRRARLERRAQREAEAAANPPPEREAEPTPTPTPTPEVARPAPTPTPEPVLDLPAQPTREQVQAALDAVRSNVAACTQNTGQVVVRVTVSGRGRVTTAVVQDTRFAGPEGSCIARAVRTARFPQFSERRFTVQYPFRL